MQRLTEKAAFGKTGLQVPPIVFGTSCLGNLYQALPDETKRQILREILACVEPPVVLDSAGKYGAGLALEVIGRELRQLGVAPDQVVLSNKLAWLRAPLRTPEPTFEPGVWVGLDHDAEQRIGYDGILECYRQGCELLGADYRPQLVSVHDPDEYLAAARSEDDRRRRWQQILDAYRALGELKLRGQVRGVGVGSKDWKTIRALTEAVDLDWVMFACSLTIMSHPPELLGLMQRLADRHIAMINSAVFHAGFLTGGDFFDYRRVHRERPEDRPLFAWRDAFFRLCGDFGVSPATACVQFAKSVPGVVSIALNTAKPERIAENVALVQADIPSGFWSALKDAGLIDRLYPHVGGP
jgi:D-threo-aldose 1-dehydrogenase